MTNEFEWVPFYEEMAKKLLTFRNKQQELVAILEAVKVNGLKDEDPKGKKIPLEEVDPFTFTTLINKHSGNRQAIILKSIRKKLQLSSVAPTHFAGIPNVDARQAWLFPYKFERGSDDVAKLWDLFEEVVNRGKITESAFSAAQGVKYAGKAKLTQAMFRASPSTFFPVDGQTTHFLARLGLPNEFKSAQEYENICSQVRNRTNKAPYVNSYEAWLSNQGPITEAQYQQAVLKKATSKKKAKHQEPAGGAPVPKQTSKGVSSGYQRNPAVAADALAQARFNCEIDPNHKTFVSSAKKLPYVEAHHLVPISKQASFSFSLDVTANVVALCPTCHRLLHHGRGADKKEYLRKLFGKRKKRLSEREIQMDEKTLLSYYRGDLLEEDV
ncbi:MAG: HNH endonuclease [Betaproteobacteria bacterium]|nr:HNH endonuclease [Betaproteobacteria bacterium]